MPFDGFTQEDYAQKMIDEYKEAGCRRATCGRSRSTRTTCCTGCATSPPSAGRPSTSTTPNTVADLPSYADLRGYRRQGIRIWAPPTFACWWPRLERQDRAVRPLSTPSAPGWTSSPGRWSARASSARRQVLLPDHRPRRSTGGDVRAARRARQGRGHPGHLLGLAGDGDLLRQLHGPAAREAVAGEGRGAAGASRPRTKAAPAARSPKDRPFPGTTARSPGWLESPAPVRELGGALFGDYRFESTRQQRATSRRPWPAVRR